MGRSQVTAGRNEAFTANIIGRALPIDSIKGLELSFYAEETGTTAVTVAALLSATAGLLSALKVWKDSKELVVNCNGADIYALNALMLGNYAHAMVGGGTQYDRTRVSGMKVPLNLPSPSQAVAPHKVDFERTAVSAGVVEAITCVAETKHSHPKYLSYQATTYTPASSGAWLPLEMGIPSGDLLGILFNSITTIPVAGADTCTLDQIRLKINGTVEEETNWESLKAGSKTGAHYTIESPASFAILDNYVFWDFREKPYSAGTSKTLQFYGGDTNSIRILPIVQV